MSRIVAFCATSGVILRTCRGSLRSGSAADGRPHRCEYVSPILDDVFGGEEVHDSSEKLECIPPALLSTALLQAEVTTPSADLDDDGRWSKVEVHPGNVYSIRPVRALEGWLG